MDCAGVSEDERLDDAVGAYDLFQLSGNSSYLQTFAPILPLEEMLGHLFQLVSKSC